MIGLLSKNKDSVQLEIGLLELCVKFWWVDLWNCPCVVKFQFQGADTVLWVGCLGVAGGIFLFPPVCLHIFLWKSTVILLNRINTTTFRGLWRIVEPDFFVICHSILMTFIRQYRKWTCVTTTYSWMKDPEWLGRLHPESSNFVPSLCGSRVVI